MELYIVGYVASSHGGNNLIFLRHRDQEERGKDRRPWECKRYAEIQFVHTHMIHLKLFFFYYICLFLFFLLIACLMASCRMRLKGYSVRSYRLWCDCFEGRYKCNQQLQEKKQIFLFFLLIAFTFILLFNFEINIKV